MAKNIYTLPFIVVFVFFINFFAFSETIDSIGKAEETALLNNLDYKTAVLEVLQAKNDLESFFKVSDSSLSLAGNYAYETNNSDWGWDAALTLPVIEKLSIGAEINQDLDTTVSINLSPLAHSSDVETTKLEYQKKIAYAKQVAEETAVSAVEAYLDWAEAKAALEVKTTTVAVKKTLYEDEKVRLDIGESDLDDVRDAFTEWSDSRTALNTAITTLQSSETELYQVLNIDPEKITIKPPSENSLKTEIKTLSDSIDIDSLSISNNYNVLDADTTVKKLELELKNTWIFDPDLSVKSALTISQETSTPEITATAALSFGLDDWQASDRQELKSELDISRQQYTQTIRTEQLNLQQAKTTSETAIINYSVAEVELEQAKELLDEAEYLNKIGEYSQAEVDETELDYQKSKNSLFSAAADHYTALRKLKSYSE
ncbi:MAG: TolC family protein [Spirochaetales bacterium]|nr:TolC family protein [Spirochaetales bacterium]